MKLIIGLGNPGTQYENTRHNVGFRFVDALSRRKELTSAGETLPFGFSEKFESELAETRAKGEKLILAKPQTFMNLSGRAVRKIINFYKIDLNDLIVVIDDKDIPLGQIRIRRSGSSAGHKGLQSTIDEVGGDQFTRVRIGIAQFNGNTQESDPEEVEIETAKFVLSAFTEREIPIINKAIAEAVEYILPYLGQEKEDQIPDHTLGGR